MKQNQYPENPYEPGRFNAEWWDLGEAGRRLIEAIADAIPWTWLREGWRAKVSEWRDGSMP